MQRGRDLERYRLSIGWRGWGRDDDFHLTGRQEGVQLRVADIEFIAHRKVGRWDVLVAELPDGKKRADPHCRRT